MKINLSWIWFYNFFISFIGEETKNEKKKNFILNFSSFFITWLKIFIKSSIHSNKLLRIFYTGIGNI